MAARAIAGSKLMVYVKLYGRLGNLLFQYATALSLGRGRAVGVTNDAATVTAMRRYGKLFDGLEVVPEAPAHCRVFRQDKCLPLIFPEIGGEDVLIDGYFQSEDFFNEVLVRARFAPETEREARLRKKYADVLSRPSVTSIHIRRGDYLRLAQFHPFVGERYFRDCLRELSDCRDFLVSGDDPDWNRRFFPRNFPDRRFVFSDETDPVDDMYLSSMCVNHIMSNSSFSWWGAWLDASPDKRVLAPSLWFGFALNPHGSVDVSSIYFKNVRIVNNRYSPLLFARAVWEQTKYGLARRWNRLCSHFEGQTNG